MQREHSASSAPVKGASGSAECAERMLSSICSRWEALMDAARSSRGKFGLSCVPKSGSICRQPKHAVWNPCSLRARTWRRVTLTATDIMEARNPSVRRTSSIPLPLSRSVLIARATQDPTRTTVKISSEHACRVPIWLAPPRCSILRRKGFFLSAAIFLAAAMKGLKFAIAISGCTWVCYQVVGDLRLLPD